MNILIVGSEGRMGSFHAKHAAKYGDVLRIDTVLMQSDYELEDLLNRADVAIIASPTGTHYEWADNLIERGVPILIEKPVALSLFDATRIKTTADFAGVDVHVGYLNRFNPAWQSLASAIDGPGRFWINRSGRLVGREYGGVGLDLATHDIDLIYQRWPDAIIRATTRAVQVFQFEVEVPSANVVGVVTASYAGKDSPNIREWTWRGEDGVMMVADLTAQSVRYPGGSVNYPDVDQVDMQMQDWLLGGRNVATIEDGIKAMEALRG